MKVGTVELGKAVSELRENWRNVDFWQDQVIPFASLLPRRLIGNAYLRISRRERENFLRRDWDNLVILDCLRYDTFDASPRTPNDVPHKLSRGSATFEFLRENFGDKTYEDIVYVTANPVVNKEITGQVHDIISVWDTDWDTDTGTVYPEAVTRATREAHEQYPNKRLVSHFVQPHVPYIGTTAQKIDGGSGAIAHTRSERAEDAQWDESEHVTAYGLLELGDISADLIWEAYEESFDLALDAVLPLVHELDGRTVLTADHGDMFGEFGWPIPRRIYGHPPLTPTEHLIKVPWWVVEDGERKLVSEDSPREQTEHEDEVIQDRLKQLGYTE